MSFIALLGDSVFDNSAYTCGEPDVVTHLRAMLPASWRAELYAVDGSTTRGLSSQLERLPADVTHVVVSVGGNDVLGHSDLLRRRVSSTAETLTLFGERVASFDRDYRSALESVRRQGRDTTICTIYNGDFGAPDAPLAQVALSMFNDVIVRYAIERRLGLIELRLVCSESADYANPIEPSGIGGRKIARAIAEAVGALPVSGPAARAYGASSA